MNDLSRERILDALRELSRRLGERGSRGEVYFFVTANVLERASRHAA